MEHIIMLIFKSAAVSSKKLIWSYIKRWGHSYHNVEACKINLNSLISNTEYTPLAFPNGPETVEWQAITALQSSKLLMGIFLSNTHLINLFIPQCQTHLKN